MSDANPAPSRASVVVDRRRLSLLGHDLRATVADIIGGQRPIDRAQIDGPTAIRAKSHVLIALAGAVGARRLQAHAQNLNLAAQRHEARDVARLGSGAAALPGRLIATIDEARARRDRTA